MRNKNNQIDINDIDIQNVLKKSAELNILLKQVIILQEKILNEHNIDLNCNPIKM